MERKYTPFRLIIVLLPGILVTKIALKPMDNEPGDYRGVHNYG
jgi:hypothetical protein